MTFAVGSLVKARGREWVVLPESEDPLLVLRPLGGTDDEIAGVHTALEKVRPAQLDLPGVDDLGDYFSCRLLRDAVRLGFRSSAGPFRSFGRIACEPRPYQVVPLLMALKLDPIRILIADDVGIGKTIEALLIARELIDRGEALRMAVLTPPHLAEQWQKELREKFNIEAELVLPSTVRRLERRCSINQSVFDVYDYTVVSTDYIKADRRRDDFLRACPKMVIVDEAHTCAFAEQAHRGRHQRHQLLKGLSADPERHLILVTATPHSGKEEAFRSLLALLEADFAALPEDLGGPGNKRHRRHLARHFVQRRRADIEHYLDTDTPFPDRQDKEETYNLSTDYKRLFERVLDYARESVLDKEGGHLRQRVRWWSALALLRSLGSSPAAAAATLRNRAAPAAASTPEEADEIGRRVVLDLSDEEAAEGLDITPGSDLGEELDEGQRNRRRLVDMARAADALRGGKDEKMKKAAELVKRILDDGFRPIVFCRFIPTAEYVAEELRRGLRGVEVTAVTGTLPPAEREKRVLQLAEGKKRVLVCTDCLSEGVNLQDHFDAVVHYDLSWNPTRHEQREGRVDRYGQQSKVVRVLTYYGIDNQIDGIVLDVLLRKHKTIRSSLGISVPVPVESDKIIEAVFEGLLLREQAGTSTEQLQIFEEFFKPQREELHSDWEESAQREKRSRTMFAQHAIRPDEVARELEAAREAVGSGESVRRFVAEAFTAHGGRATGTDPVELDLRETPRGLRDSLGSDSLDTFRARFELPVEEGVLHLHRTHPIVDGLAGYVLTTALDPIQDSVARRAGVIRTQAVSERTTTLLLRYRFHVLSKKDQEEKALLAEDCQLVGFSGSPQNPTWLDSSAADELLAAQPDVNVAPDIASHQLRSVLDSVGLLTPQLEQFARLRGDNIQDAHGRVRAAARDRGVKYTVEPKLPVDILGLYIFLPAK